VSRRRKTCVEEEEKPVSRRGKTCVEEVKNLCHIIAFCRKLKAYQTLCMKSVI
jgi:hypothetical protein